MKINKRYVGSISDYEFEVCDYENDTKKIKCSVTIMMFNNRPIELETTRLVNANRLLKDVKHDLIEDIENKIEMTLIGEW